MKKNLFSFFKNEKNKDNRESSDTSFARISETFKEFFSAEPEKERVLRHSDFDRAGDTYYATVSAWYKVLERVFLVCLALFAIVSVTVNFKHITYDNFFYLIKDFNTAVDTETVNYETLSYDASENQSFCLYRGGLAVVSRSNVSAFTATGRRTLNSNDSYSKPFAVASDKYLLVYDMGDGNMSIYNSFAKVYSEKLNYPVVSASFSKDGSFALLTRSEKYESEIIVYSKDFEKLVTYRKGSYATDVAISEDGKTLGAIYCDTDNGLVCTKVLFYDLSKHEKINEYVYTGEFPLSCSFLGGGGFSVITDGSVKIFDKALREKTESKGYSGGLVSALWSDEEYVAVAFNDGVVSNKNELLVFDRKGEQIYSETVDSDILGLCICDGYIFIKNADGARRISMKNSSFEQFECQDGKMLVYDKDTALVCAEAKAVYIKFDN